MTRTEWYRLRGYMQAKRNAPTWNHLSKRHIKGNAKGVGCITKHSYIKPQVGIERIFINHP